MNMPGALIILGECNYPRKYIESNLIEESINYSKHSVHSCFIFGDLFLMYICIDVYKLTTN